MPCIDCIDVSNLPSLCMVMRQLLYTMKRITDALNVSVTFLWAFCGVNANFSRNVKVIRCIAFIVLRHCRVATDQFDEIDCIIGSAI
jgi:hypothetical protein